MAGMINGVNSDESVSLVVQINCWLSLSASIVGSFTASTLVYRKFYLHDIVFTALSGAIAFSSSTDVNWNPGVAITIGFFIGMACSLVHTPMKSAMNEKGVKESNSVIFPFIVPGLAACIVSSILQACGESPIDGIYPANKNPDNKKT